MSTSRAAPQWLFSQEYNSWFIYDRQHHTSILQDGRRIPGRLQDSTATPRTLPNAQQFHVQPQYQASRDAAWSHTAASSPPGRGSVAQTTPLSTDASIGVLTQQLGAARIAPSPQVGGQPFASNRTGYTSQSGPSPPILTGYNAQTRVTSNVQIAAPETYTDPALQRAGILSHRRLVRSEGEAETLDPSFRLRKDPKKFFGVGRVFLTLWSEPIGETTDVASVLPLAKGSKGKYGERIHSKVRRFVVVREGTQSCSAVPILTYRGAGTSLKRLAEQAEHGIVFTGKVAPAPDRRETNLLPRAVRVDPDNRDDSLDPMSRIHYGKIYTVEHNVKVETFGMVNRDYQETLISNFRDVWVMRVGHSQGSKPAQGQQAQGQLTSDAARRQSGQEGYTIGNPRRATLDAIPEHAQGMERHYSIASAMEDAGVGHRTSRANLSRQTASSRDGSDGHSQNLDDLDEDQKAKLREAFMRARDHYLEEGFEERDAVAKARTFIAEGLDRLRTKLRPSLQASSSRQADNPGTSGRSLAGASGDGSTSQSVPVQRSSQRTSPEALRLGTSASSATAGSSRARSTTRRSEDVLSYQQLLDEGYDAIEAAAILKLMTSGRSQTSAKVIMALRRRGWNIDLATRIADLVDAGWTLADAIDYVTNRSAGDSRDDAGKDHKSSGKGKGKEL